MMKMKTFLITGGDGFIGSHVCERLLQEGRTVRLLDNQVARNGANVEFLTDLAGRRETGKLEVIKDDVRDLSACLAAAKGVDYIIHLAALGSVPRSVNDPGETHDVNATGTLNMLRAGVEARVDRLVWSSSSSVYGDQGKPTDPKVETLPTKPLSPYGVTKLTGEQYARVFHELYGLPVVTLRYFNVFGPRQDPNGAYAAVIPKFIAAMKAGQPPVVDGDGRQSRDFTYVANVVDANLAALTAAEAAGKIMNVAAGETHDLIELIDIINAEFGSAVEPTFGPARPGDIRYSLSDSSLAGRILGFRPRIGFKEGLIKTIESFS